jgi:hypothetical protein
MSSERKRYVPQEIDDTEDRMGSVHPLDFDDDSDQHEGRAGDTRPPAELAREFPDKRVREAGMTGGEALGADVHEDGVTMDDMSPETMLDETAARDPGEPGDGDPADYDLSIVDEDQIGAGGGLDEAQEGRVHPLDGKPWKTREALRSERDERSDELGMSDEELAGEASLEPARDVKPE